MKRVLIYQFKGNVTGRWYEPECYCFKDEEDEKRCIEIGNTDDSIHNIKIIEVEDDVEEIDLTEYISNTDILK